MKKPELIEDWRKCWRFWSVRLSLLGSAILAAFFAYPDAMLHVWSLIPDDLKAHIPAKYAPFIPLSIIFAGVAARIFKQTNLRKGPNDEQRTSLD